MARIGSLEQLKRRHCWHPISRDHGQERGTLTLRREQVGHAREHSVVVTEDTSQQ